jgi:hypothetical protein
MTNPVFCRDEPPESGGYLLNTQAKRYNFRVNSEHKIKDWLTIGENMYYNYSDGNTADTKSGYTGAVVAAMYYPPNVPVYTPSGAFQDCRLMWQEAMEI